MSTTLGLKEDALAAKGYQEAFQQVQVSVVKVLNGDSPDEVFHDDVQNWYLELFKLSVQDGVVEASQIAGYRNRQVYISGSRHIPPPPDATWDSMNTLERLLMDEKSAAV